MKVSLLGEGTVRIEGSAEFVSAISGMLIPYIMVKSIDSLAVKKGITCEEAARQHLDVIDKTLAKASVRRK